MHVFNVSIIRTAMTLQLKIKLKFQKMKLDNIIDRWWGNKMQRAILSRIVPITSGGTRTCVGETKNKNENESENESEGTCERGAKRPTP